MDVSMMSRMKGLEVENRRLKGIYLKVKLEDEIVAEALKKSGEAISQARDGSSVAERGVCIRLVCQAYGVNESCYRYEHKLDVESAEEATWLLRLSDNHRSCGFGLCYLYLRNFRRFIWNH
jgi:putative transposase